MKFGIIIICLDLRNQKESKFTLKDDILSLMIWSFGFKILNQLKAYKHEEHHTISEFLLPISIYYFFTCPKAKF